MDFFSNWAAFISFMGHLCWTKACFLSIQSVYISNRSYLLSITITTCPPHPKHHALKPSRTLLIKGHLKAGRLFIQRQMAGWMSGRKKMHTRKCKKRLCLARKVYTY